MAAEGAGEDSARPVGGGDAHLPAGPQRRGDLAEGDGGVVDDLEHGMAKREVEAGVGTGALP